MNQIQVNSETTSKPDKWHWLRHRWSNWKVYELPYPDYAGGTIHQQRVCLTCGKIQDEIVKLFSKLMPHKEPNGK